MLSLLLFAESLKVLMLALKRDGISVLLIPSLVSLLSSSHGIVLLVNTQSHRGLTRQLNCGARIEGTDKRVRSYNLNVST